MVILKKYCVINNPKLFVNRFVIKCYNANTYVGKNAQINVYVRRKFTIYFHVGIRFPSNVVNSQYKSVNNLN